jgi:hypothetical protein
VVLVGSPAEVHYLLDSFLDALGLVIAEETSNKTSWTQTPSSHSFVQALEMESVKRCKNAADV